MKNLYTILLSLFALQAFAQSPTILYGLTQSPGNGFYLASLDPASGLVTEISTTPIASTVVGCYATLDPVNDLFYFFAPDTLVGVNTTTGAVVSRAAMVVPPNHYLEMPLYNCQDSSIYGIYRDAGATPSTMLLAKVNPQNGIITIISPSTIDSGFVASTKGSIDPDAGIYYFEGISGYKGVSLTTGQIIYNCIPSFSGPGIYFTLSAWDCDDDLLFGLAQAQGTLYPATMNLSTGAVTNLTTQGIATNGYYMCTAEINSTLGLFHYSDVNGFITMNTTSGNIVSNVPLTFSPLYGSIYFDWVARDNCKCYIPEISSVDESSYQTLRLRSENPILQNSLLTIDFPSSTQNNYLSVYSSTGSLVQEIPIENGTTSITFLADFAPGIYLLHTGNSIPLKIAVIQ